MSFERHHPNRDVDRNLAKARDLRSTHLFACLATIANSWRSHGAPGGQLQPRQSWNWRSLQSARNPLDRNESGDRWP